MIQALNYKGRRIGYVADGYVLPILGGPSLETLVAMHKARQETERTPSRVVAEPALPFVTDANLGRRTSRGECSFCFGVVPQKSTTCVQGPSGRAVVYQCPECAGFLRL